MAKFDIKTVKPKFVVTTSPENKIDVVVNKPIIETKLSKSFFKLKNTGGPRGQRGPQGEPGVPGRDGQDGQSATIEVASTTTLPAGSSATVENVGTDSAARLVFGIPKGEKGDSGSGSGDMTASTYDPNGTVAAAGGIPDYVDSNGGKIDTIEVNGTPQTITNKTVDIAVPTDTSDLTNGAGYITSSSLPTVNDATLIIQKNGTTVETFTANSSSNKTANITVPTDTSDLTNGAGYITSSALPTVNDATLTIQHNGTNVQTFTANQGTNATANIETIWADDIEATTPVPAVETAMIADGAVTSAKIADGAVTGAKLDTQSYNLASVPTHTFGTNVYSLIRVANIVILNFRLWQSGAITDYAWNDVCTIPSALYPSKECRGTISVLNGNTGQTISVCRSRLTTAGQIGAYPTANGGTAIIGWEGLFVWTI